MRAAEIVGDPETELHRWTADEFMGLIKAGLIHEPRQVELLDGIIVRKMPPGDDHTFLVENLYLFFVRQRLVDLGLIPAAAVILGERNAIEPDFARFREGALGRYGIKRDADVLWAVEVSVTSAAKDLGPKKRAYAEAGVPDYWVVDEGRRGVWTFSRPVAGVYREERFFPEGEAVPLPGLDAALDTIGLFPPSDRGTRSV